MGTQGGTALLTRVAGSLELVPDIFPAVAPCIPAAGATDYSGMRARCDWCGMQVEVLASGRCLLGHAVSPLADIEAPPLLVDAIPKDLTPRRGRRRRPVRHVEDTAPGTAALFDTGPPGTASQESRSIRTAPTPPRRERPPVRERPPPETAEGPSTGPSENGDSASAESLLPKMPRVSRPWAPVEPDGPSGPVDSEPDLGPPPMFDVAAPGLGAPMRLNAPPEPAGRSDDIERALRDLLGGGATPGEGGTAAPTIDAPGGARRLRLPFRRSERRRPAVERPDDAQPVAQPVAYPPQSARTKTKKLDVVAEPVVEQAPPEPVEPKAAASVEAVEAGAVDMEEPKKPASQASPKRRAPLIDSLAPMPPAARKTAAVKKAPAPAPALPTLPVPPAAPSPTGFGIPTTYHRARRPRGGPFSPRNTVAWGLAIAAMFSAGVAALILSPSSADDGARIRPGLRRIALGAVQDYAVRPDPETETRLRAELTAQGAVPRQLSASTVVDPENGDIVALYQAIVFSSNVVGSQRDLDDFLRLFAEGAGITADAFAERVLGRRTVWAGLLDQGQAVIVFRGPEVVIVITAEVGAAGDELADAVLLARDL